MINPVTELHSRPVRTLVGLFHESVHTLFQLLLLSLLLLGIGGLAFKALGTDGWLQQLLASAWDSGGLGHASLVLVALLAAGAWIKRLLYRRPHATHLGGDALAIGFLLMGAFFGLRLLVTGSL